MTSDKENRILELLKNNNLNYKDLIMYLIEETEGKESDYNTIKTNFSKMISGKRNFKYEYIPLIERKLKTTLDYILNGESKNLNEFIPRGLRYAAYIDNEEKYKSLLQELKIENNIIYIYDEYNKNIADYIIDYKSINGIKYLIDNDLIKYLNTENVFGIIDIIIDKKPEYLSNILNFHLCSESSFDELLKKDDIEIKIGGSFDFNTVFKKNISKYQELIDKIIQNDNLFNLFFLEDEDYKADYFLYKDNNYEVYSFNIIILFIFDRLNHSYSIYKECNGWDKLKKIDSLLSRYNDIIHKEIYENEISAANVSIEDLEFDYIDKDIYSDKIYYSSFWKNNKAALIFRYNKHDSSVIDGSIKKDFEKLSNRFSKSSIITNNKIRIEDNKVYKTRSNNEKEYEFLKFMEQNNYKKVPKYYGNENNEDIFEYIKGNTEKYVYTMPIEKIYQVLDTIKEINEISKKHLKGKVYVHNDLSPLNAVFNNNGKITGIIDWEHCKIGEEYEDLIYIIWTWSNIGALDRKHEQLLDYFEKIIKYYNPNDKVRKDFVDKMKKVMDSKQQEAKEKYGRDSKEYIRIYEWVEWSKIWVRFNRDIITKIVNQK